VRRHAFAALLAIAACGHAAAPHHDSLAEGDRKLAIGGATVAIHIRGHGPPCVVEPGGPGLEWTYLRMPAVEKVLTLIYIEPVGTGGSTRVSKEELTIARWANDIEGVRAALGLDRMYLLGHSYGGFVAQRYALAHGDRLLGLVLYDTSPRTGDNFGTAMEAGIAGFKAEPWFADAEQAMAAEANAASDAELTAIFHRSAPIMFADWTHRQADLAPLLANVHAFAPEGGDSTPFDTRAALPALHVPALVIVGRHDAIIGPQFSEELHAALPGSRLVVLEHSGHMGHVEEPEAFAAAVASFVRR
jgi:proline iminopeptidase